MLKNLLLTGLLIILSIIITSTCVYNGLGPEYFITLNVILGGVCGWIYGFNK